MVDWASVVSSVVAFCVYINTLDSDFVYDDNRAILSNEDVQPDAPLSNLIFHDFWGTPLSDSGSHGSYRPLTVLSFRMNLLLAGEKRASARSFHLTNVFLHSVTTAVFVKCVRRLATHHPLTAWGSGLLFAVHPIHTEAVAGVVGRADVGAALFLLLAFLAYSNHIKCRDRDSSTSHVYLVLTLLLGMCAVFTKEPGISVFAICVVYDVLYSNHSPYQLLQCLIKLPSLQKVDPIPSSNVKVRLKSLLSSSLWLILAFCLLTALRTYLIGGKFPNFATADNPAAKSDSFLTRTLTFFYLPIFNFYLLLCPTTLSFDWSMESIPLITTIVDKRNLATVVFYSALTWIVQKHINIIHGSHQSRTVASDKLLDVNCNQKCPSESSDRYIPIPKYHRKHDHNISTSDVVHTCRNSPSRCAIMCFNNNNNPSSKRQYNVSVASGNDQSKVVLMGIALLVLPFIPATNLMVHVGFVVAERVLYMPSLGYCLLVSHGFTSILSSKKRNKVAGILLTLGMLAALGGKTVLRNRDWNNEESLYRSGINVNPPKAYGNLGTILSLKGNQQEAESCYRKALTYRPNMADVHYNLGALLQSQQRWQEAIKSYRAAIQYRSKLSVAYLNLGVVMARLGRLAEAMSILKEGANIDGTGLKDPRSHALAITSCLFQLGRLSMEQGHLPEAVEVFQKAVRSMPSHYQPQSLYNLLGETYCRLGRDSEAEFWFRAALNSKPDHVPAHLTYGRLLSRNGSRVQEAEVWFSKAEDLAPEDAGVLRHYGQFLLSQNRPKEAMVKFERAMELSSVQYEDAMNVATSLRLTGDLEKAEIYYKLAVELRPQEPSSIANLGALYHMRGRLEEAKIYYNKALKLHPEDEVTKGNLKRLRRLQAVEDGRRQRKT